MKVKFCHMKILFYVYKNPYLSFSILTQKDVRHRFFNRNFISQFGINPFIPNAPVFYPMKTSENHVFME